MVSASVQPSRSQRSRLRLQALCFKVACSSCNRYLPTARVSLRNEFSMTLVSASANCAPECTHLKLVPSWRKSLIARACNWVLNSWQFGIAVREIKSNRDLQSMVATSDSSGTLKGDVEIASGSSFKASSGFLHFTAGFSIQPQNSFNHDNWSKADESAIVSADKVKYWSLPSESSYNPMRVGW